MPLPANRVSPLKNRRRILSLASTCSRATSIRINSAPRSKVVACARDEISSREASNQLLIPAAAGATAAESPGINFSTAQKIDRSILDVLRAAGGSCRTSIELLTSRAISSHLDLGLVLHISVDESTHSHVRPDINQVGIGK